MGTSYPSSVLIWDFSWIIGTLYIRFRLKIIRKGRRSRRTVVSAKMASAFGEFPGGWSCVRSFLIGPSMSRVGRRSQSVNINETRPFVGCLRVLTQSKMSVFRRNEAPGTWYTTGSHIGLTGRWHARRAAHARQ